MGDAAEAPIPLAPNQQSGLEELAGGSPVAMNITIDSLGAVTRRPGISDYRGRTQSASTDQIIGLHESNGGTLYGVRQTGAFRRIVAINATTEVILGDLTGTGRPTWADTEDRTAIAGGDAVMQLLASGGRASKLGGSPPFASHVAANTAHLLLNDLTQFPKLAWFSAISGFSGGYETWSVGPGASAGDAGSFQALPNMEPCVALAEGNGIIFTWGRTRMEVFVPDAQVVYNPETSVEYGCVAPYSVIKVDQSFAWLDHLRRFVLSDGRTVTPLSDPYIQADLNEMTRVDDCFAWRFLFGNTDAIVWTFPTDGRSYVFQKAAGWSQWQGWNATANDWADLPITAHHLRASNNENVVGTNDGRIGLLSPVNNTDFGAQIPAYIVTGFQDRGTNRLKACRAVRLAIRRGESGAATEPVGYLWYRDDLGDWRGGIPVGFGAPSDHSAVVRLPSVGGTYRRRQWKWSFSGSGPMVLASVVEEFEVLGS